VTVSRHKCRQCQKLMPKRGTYIVLYDASINYLYYFCSWWHLTKYYLRKIGGELWLKSCGSMRS
jgi:hypothetical protein